MFSQWNFASSIGQFFGSAVTYTLQKSEELPLASLFEVFTGLWLSIPTFCIKDYNYVKRFIHVLCIGFISDKYRVSQKIAKRWGTPHC